MYVQLVLPFAMSSDHDYCHRCHGYTRVNPGCMHSHRQSQLVIYVPCASCGGISNVARTSTFPRCPAHGTYLGANNTNNTMQTRKEQLLMGIEHANSDALLSFYTSGTRPDLSKVGGNTPNQHNQKNLLTYLASPSALSAVIYDFEQHVNVSWMTYGNPTPAGLQALLKSSEMWTDNHSEIYLGWSSVAAWIALKGHVKSLIDVTERWFTLLMSGLTAGSTPDARCVFPGARSDGASLLHGKDGSSMYYDTVYNLIRHGGHYKLPKHISRDTVGLFALADVLKSGGLKSAQQVTLSNCATSLPPCANAWSIYRFANGHVGVMETTHGIQPQAWCWTNHVTGKSDCATSAPAFSADFEHLQREDMEAKATTLGASAELGNVVNVIHAPTN